VIRTTVGGNAIIANPSGTQTGEGPFEDILDSTEVVSNTIGRNLICHGNSPAAQIGEAATEGGGPDTVGGHKLGECAGLRASSRHMTDGGRLHGALRQQQLAPTASCIRCSYRNRGTCNTSRCGSCGRRSGRTRRRPPTR